MSAEGALNLLIIEMHGLHAVPCGMRDRRAGGDKRLLSELSYSAARTREVLCFV